MTDDATIDDIIAELKPLRQRCGDPREPIRQAIAIAVALKAHPLPPAGEVRAKARAAQKTWDILRAHFPDEPVPETIRHFDAVDPKKASGPDKRFNYLAWICAFQACVLVEKFSRKSPASTAGGVVHNISQIIFAAVSGERIGEKAALLKAVRSALAFRR